MYQKYFYFFVSFFFVGVFLETFFQIFSFWFFLIILFFVIYFFAKFFCEEKINKKIFLFFVIIFAFFFGSLRYEIWTQSNVGDFENLLNQNFSKNFVVVEEPEIKNGKQKIVVSFENSSSKAFLFTDIFPQRFYGDKIYIEGFLKYPKNFENENGRDFDYISYLKKDKIFYQIEPVKIKFLEKNKGNFIKEKLFQIKNSFLNQIKKIVPTPENSLLGGILLGAKEDLDKELLDDFRKTGIIHIVVLSGYNLSLVADFFIKIFSFFGLAFASIFGGISIIFFAIMTGASSTIIRASIMALIILFAKATGRNDEAISALFLAGFFMIFYNPQLLVYDPSFQLSFMATLGLLALSEKIEKKLKFLPKKFLDIRGIMAATLATQIFIFPLLLFMMGEISVISPIVNILILIFIPFAMFLSIIAILFSYLNLYLGIALAFPVYLILFYDLALVDFFAKLPFAIFATNFFGFYTMAFCYFLYFIIFFFHKNKKILT